MPELRVFISSTFRDLQEEREHLVKKIFPEIRALCRERGITFTEVDLRWGLTDEDVVLGQVIRTCLEEVDKCRPYFIGITGDRYGFVPSYLDIQKDPELLTQYTWIEDATIDGMSITEMEAQYAVLNASLAPKASMTSMPSIPHDRARFYFRRHRESLDDAHSNDEERTRLEAYQHRIRQSGATIEEFRDPFSLGELIYDDLVRIIKQDFADAKPPTPLEQERSRHEAFAISRRRAYIANPLYIKRLNDHVTSDDPPLVAYAESGSGKSSLFAFWAEQYRRKHPEAHVIEHYVGIGTTATDHYAVIRHICMEINERFGRDEEIPSDPAKIETALGQWFGYADHTLQMLDQRIVIILDGLNQLQGTALNLRWIPDVIAPSIRLILSSTVEGTLVELEKRGWVRFGMQALTEAERETIIVRYLAEYRKSLNPEQIKRIATDYKCGHPLFLKTVLEEIRLVGRHEELDAKIASYLEATGTEDLFQRVLERLEDDYSQRAVRDVMSLLSAARFGLDERELSEITGLARLKTATMVAGLDYHLVRKEGRLTFFHDYLRRAVEKRYLADEAKRRAAHLLIAEYFQSAVNALITSSGVPPLRMASELCYQFQSSGAIERLRDCLSNMPVFLSLFTGPSEYEVLAYWSALGEDSDVAGRYRRALAEWSMEDAGERSRAIGRVTDLLQRLGEWVEAIALNRQRLASAIEHGHKNEEAAARHHLGSLLGLVGEYAEAIKEFERALALFTELGDRRGICAAIGSMGSVYDSRGEYDRGIECFERQLRIAEELGDRYEISHAIGGMAMVFSGRGENDRAIECYERQLRICEELGNRDGASIVIGNIGVIYANLGEYDRAIECYERFLRISEEMGFRRGAGIANGNMGRLHHSRGEYEQALECFHRAADVHRAIGFRYGLTYWLEGIGRVLVNLPQADRMPDYLPRYVPAATLETWRTATLTYARTCAGECITISDELPKPDSQFSARILMAYIEGAEGRTDLALQRLSSMLANATDEAHRAELHYFLWRFGEASYREEALALNEKMYAATKNQTYLTYIEELKTAGEPS